MENEFTLQIQIEDTKVDEEKNVEDNAGEDRAENAKGAIVDYLIQGCPVKLLNTAV